MKITTYHTKKKLTTTIWDSNEYPKGVNQFDDNELFFDIPSSIISRHRTFESKVNLTYLLSKLRFLITYDYNLYKKKKIISRLDVPESMNIDVDLNKIIGICNCDLQHQKENTDEYYLAYNRLKLFERALYRDVEIKSEWTAKNLKVFGSSFIKLFAECQSQYRKYVRVIQDTTLTRDFDFIHKPELVFAYHLKPFADSYRSSSMIHPTLNDDRFLLLIARALFLTGGRFRSNLYTLLDYIGAVPSMQRKTIQNNSPKMLALFTTNIKVHEGKYTISSGEIEINFDASSVATSLGKRNLISDEMVKKVSETIEKSYEEYKKNSYELNRSIEMECRASNSGVLPSTKEHWIAYQNSLRKEWFNEIKKGNEQSRLKPILCFYYIVLQNESLDSFFEESFIKDFIIMCQNNPGVSINPDLFNAMYRIDLIKARTSNTSSAFEAATQNVATSKMTDSQQIKFDLAKNEINQMLQNLVNNKLVNICAFNPRDNFITLIDAIILDEFFRDKIIANTAKGYNFNLKLLLNIIGVLRDDKDFNVFEAHACAKTIVKTMDSSLDALNMSRFITKATSDEERYTLFVSPKLNQDSLKLTTKIKKIATLFIENTQKHS